MRRKGSILTAVIVCTTVVLLVVGGCGEPKKKAEETEEPPATTSAGLTPSSGAQFGPDGTPVKTLGSFPDGQDGANVQAVIKTCLLYTSDAADDLLCVDLGGRRIIKKKKHINII